MITGDDALFNQPIVLDNGSGIIKAGFGGEEKPKCYEYSLIGKPKYSKIMTGGLDGDTFVGNQAQISRGLLRLNYPLKHGIVEDWNGLEQLWAYVFDKSLQVNNLKEHPVLVTEAPLNPMKNREQMCELLFETFNVPAVYVSIQAVLSLYASGRTTGCVLDSGDGCSHVVPVYDGYTLLTAIRRIDIAGRDISEFLQNLLRKSAGVSLLSSSEREIVRIMKEKACYIAIDPIEEEKKYSSIPEKTMFKLPDGKQIELTNEKFRAPEILFNPQLIGSEFQGIHEILYESSQKIDLDLRPSLLSNIVFSGGNTMIPGFGDRMLKELKQRCEPQTKIKIYAPPERKYSTWMGGSILSGLSTFKKIWVDRKAWDEDPSCVHTKFM